MLAPGLSATADYVVAAEDTAVAVGSGDLLVLGTPRLLAWWEAATCTCVADQIDAASTTVGSRVDVQHLAASKVGSAVRVRATLAAVDGRLLRFEVVAHDADDRMLGHGSITRVVVNRVRFLERLA